MEVSLMLYPKPNHVQHVARDSRQHRRLRCQADKRNTINLPQNGLQYYQLLIAVKARACRKGMLNGAQEGEEVVRKQEQETLDRDAAAKKAEADAKRRQREAAHNDAVAAFQTLLAETVKDSSAKWQVGTSPAHVTGSSP